MNKINSDYSPNQRVIEITNCKNADTLMQLVKTIEGTDIIINGHKKYVVFPERQNRMRNRQRRPSRSIGIVSLLKHLRIQKPNQTSDKVVRQYCAVILK